MPAQILTTSGDLEQVRKALDASLTTDDLPDATIQLPFYLDVGEAMIIAKVPDWATLTGTDQVYLKAGTVAQVAALLAPAMPGILPKSEDAITYKITRETIDWKGKGEELKLLSATISGSISTQAPITIPSQIALTGPTRSARNKT
jgi:hypothetical protein